MWQSNQGHAQPSTVTGADADADADTGADTDADTHADPGAGAVAGGAGAKVVQSLLLSASGTMPSCLVLPVSTALHRIWRGIGTDRCVYA